MRNIGQFIFGLVWISFSILFQFLIEADITYFYGAMAGIVLMTGLRIFEGDES